MKRVASSELLAEVGHFKNVLEQAGIACVIKNEQLSGGLGEIPWTECIPELWVVDDGQQEKALRLIEEQRTAATPSLPWRCSSCGESNEGQFAACWQCGEACRAK